MVDRRGVYTLEREMKVTISTGTDGF